MPHSADASSSSWTEGSNGHFDIPPSYLPTPWDPDRLYENDYEVVDEVVPVDTSVALVPSEPSPIYSFSRIPPNTVTYSFSSLGHSTSAMVVLPPADSVDPRPLYHISVGQDPFFPSCSITTVVQGETSEGVLVGFFRTVTGIELKKDSDAETVCMRGYENTMKAMFAPVPFKRLGLKLTKYAWDTSHARSALVWSCSSSWPLASPNTCHTPTNPKRVLARFTPIDRLHNRNRDQLLTITPDGHPHFDDILMSVLLLERQRRMDLYTKRSMSDLMM